jgi:hypothetical protein
MASIRVALRNEARRLAAADDAGAFSGEYHVPAAAILRLHRMVQVSDRPVEALRWAWRSQLATYVDSQGHLDGLAAMYLHAALLAIEHGSRDGGAPGGNERP